jgi:hypothetical protein
MGVNYGSNKVRFPAPVPVGSRLRATAAISDVIDVHGTTLAVLSLCIDVARWFNVDGPRTPDEVGALYADLVLRMVGAAKQAD